MNIYTICYRLVLAAVLWEQVASVFQDDFNIPVTVEVPSGHENDTLRLHLAAYGAVPYGEVMAGVRIVHYPRDCNCAGRPCNTGCADLRLAPERCRRALRDTEHNVFVVEETSDDIDDGCSRAERAFNTAKVGARGLIIIANANDTNYIAAVDSQDTSAAVETLQFLEHVHMPIGVMNHVQGHKLKTYVREAEKANSVPRLKMDFTHEEKGERVVVNVWHDTDDDCGVLCHDVHVFIADLTALVQQLDENSPISIVPRYLYQTCDGDAVSTDRCKRGCVNNGKYCVVRGSRSARAPGAMVAQENLRQSCLYEAFSSNKHNSKLFWQYKTLFQDNCKSASGTFGVKCSEEQFRKLTTIAKGDVAQAAWQNCTAAINSGAQSIPVADADITEREAQHVALFLQATVAIAVSDGATSHHYKGDLSAVHVMKAACSRLTEAARGTVPMCDRLNKGMCRPGGPGEEACKTQANQDKHTSKCVEVDTNLGYTCDCDPGYATISDDDGLRICENRNECSEFPSLCGRFVNKRNACRDTAGSFECIEDLEQQCSAEKNWGGCWTGEAHGFRYHSCEDLVGKVRFNLQQGDEMGPLSQCNCEFIKGCWSGGTGQCRERCPVDQCNFETGQCDSTASLSTGGVVGISFAVVIAVACAALIAFFIVRRRKSRRDPAKGVVTNYNNFRDGMDADEMQRSGTVEMYVAGAAANTGPYGSGKIPPGVVIPPPNGDAVGERPPTYAAQNSFVGSLTIAETEPQPPLPQ